MSVSDEVIGRFLATGTVDPRLPGWPGNAVERRRNADTMLRGVLGRVVARASAHAPLAQRPVPKDGAERVRARITPLVTGFFSPAEAALLLDALPARVVVLTPSGFSSAIAGVPLRTAWDLANLLLEDLGAPPLADDTPELDGLCAGGRAFVLPRALEVDWPDVAVHEVAHLLHTLRRGELALQPPEAPLLRVPPRRRETFAYACEIWCHALRDPDAPRRWEALPDADARVDRAALSGLLRRAWSEPERGWEILRTWATAGVG